MPRNPLPHVDQVFLGRQLETRLHVRETKAGMTLTVTRGDQEIEIALDAGDLAHAEGLIAKARRQLSPAGS